uniref:Carboxylesterase type B domain-containing protein n=1 Tax=Maylandia zebra TaxID=106582 RepID=A0A3P9CNF0_9CICH
MNFKINLRVKLATFGTTLFNFNYLYTQKRLSFVGSDHGDEIFIVLGFLFCNMIVLDPCPEDEEQLSKIMMSYWGNFARTGSPDGHNLVHWPKYGAEEKYLAIGLKKQVTAQHLKKERFVFLTQTVPEKIKQHEENTGRRKKGLQDKVVN